MTRNEALALVAPFVEQIDGYSGVPIAAVHELLGERFERLAANKIRFVGPRATPHDTPYIYPWNVADYLQFPEL